MTNAYRRVVGDTGPPIRDTLVADDSPVDISGATARIHITKPDGNTVTSSDSEDVTIEDAVGGEVRYDFQSGDLDQEGRYLYEWEVTFNDNSVQTYPSDDERAIWVREELA